MIYSEPFFNSCLLLMIDYFKQSIWTKENYGFVKWSIVFFSYFLIQSSKFNLPVHIGIYVT